MAISSPPYFEKHVFFCTNQRKENEGCCQDFKAEAMRGYAKDCCKKLGISGEGRIRINTAGCLDRCELGPVLVVYPEGVWYTYVDKSDVDEIISEHLQNGRIVERLRV